MKYIVTESGEFETANRKVFYLYDDPHTAGDAAHAAATKTGIPHLVLKLVEVGHYIRHTPRGR